MGTVFRRLQERLEQQQQLIYSLESREKHLKAENAELTGANGLLTSSNANLRGQLKDNKYRSVQSLQGMHKPFLVS